MTMDITNSICNYLNITSEKYIQPLGATKHLMDNCEMELKQLMKRKCTPPELNNIMLALKEYVDTYPRYLLYPWFGYYSVDSAQHAL